MLSTDYPVEALRVLLVGDCLSERYAPLLPYRDALLAGLRLRGCRTKSDAEGLPDGAFIELGLPDAGTVRLLRRFLTIYDPAPQKFREIGKVTADPAEREAFRELYHLPGVKAVRARLYYRSGYRSIAEIAAASPEEILSKTDRAIAEHELSCIVPLPKEVRTHIAVAKAFTWQNE